jgi:hypothetical protein
MAVGAKKNSPLKRTSEVIDYVRKHALKKEDKDIVQGLRRLTGDKRWNKKRVYHIRQQLGLFKERTFTTRRTYPIGTIRIHRGPNRPKEKRIKVGPVKWVGYSRYVWEQHNGPILRGCVIVHLDNDKMNCDIGNLAMMTHKKAGAYVTRFVAYDEEWRKRTGEGVLDANERKRRKVAANAYLTHTPYEFSR